jgi:uncharacterized membrane protein YkvA (DUF1232 family)
LAVSTWSWIGAAFAIALAIYVALVLTLLVVGRRTDARAWAGFVPDCAILFTRLVKDPRVPRRHKILLALLVGYLSMPFDLIPDFIPVVGALDDAIIVAVVLRTLFRGAGPAAQVESPLRREDARACRCPVPARPRLELSGEIERQRMIDVARPRLVDVRVATLRGPIANDYADLLLELRSTRSCDFED